jgi:hypothetical protein
MAPVAVGFGPGIIPIEHDTLRSVSDGRTGWVARWNGATWIEAPPPLCPAPWPSARPVSGRAS